MSAGLIALIVLGSFILLMLTGIPVGFGIGAGALLGFALLGGDPSIVPQKLYAGADVYTYLCILLFILAADIMSIGGITYSLVRFCDTLVGHVRGGLAHVNTLASMLFAGLSGSATADACGLGPIEIELMTKGGYPRDFSTCVTAATAIIGPIIPPSNIMIIFATCAGTVSIGRMFAGGIIPGVLLGVCYMVYCWYVSKKRNYPKREKRATAKEILKATKETLPALAMVVMIFCFITFGVATATETAAIAVLYAIIVAVAKKNLSIKSLYRSCIRSAKSTASVMFIIAISNAMGWVITTMGISKVMQDFFLTYVSSKYVFLIFVNSWHGSGRFSCAAYDCAYTLPDSCGLRHRSSTLRRSSLPQPNDRQYHSAGRHDAVCLLQRGQGRAVGAVQKNIAVLRCGNGCAVPNYYD